MLLPHEALVPAAYGFQYVNRAGIPIQLEGIGWEQAAGRDYRWNGLSRGERHAAVFQYTLSGRGELVHQGKTYVLERHSGFFATIPSDHEYYVPPGDTDWEFLFITVHGEDAFRHWSAIIDQEGPVLPFKDDSAPVQIVSQLFADISRSDGFDKYAVSAELYRFIMEVRRLIDSETGRTSNDIPAPLRLAIEHMRVNLERDLSLDELCGVAGLTKHYFCRHFRTHVGMSPIPFLRKLRIERAAWLLRNTNATVADIARAAGFENCNYFIKLFRSLVGTTPGKFRSNKEEYYADNLRFET